ncbi:hypothetical protein JCGZ_11640 [Jatropha curcas]|uniref:EF-hand domain-containing protein n=1 Tax=Jatropha curcas TaxID=180498 RepID=A0A067KHH5_JATCU|nr:probable calcium-binding protein CML46 [Jatropha curcas]KDP31264.1 hypothetical protein JCGZ_11640 [Jatropha curcas]
MEYTKYEDVSAAADSVSLVGILFLLTILDFIITLKDFYSGFCQLSNSFLNVFFYIKRVSAESWESSKKHFIDRYIKNRKNLNYCSEELGRGEVAMVMKQIGTCYDPDGDKLKDRLGSNDITTLFEEEEPSFQEIREAFSMFDENNDGFIDSKELRKVVCTLCSVEATEEECRRMIRAYDDNGDGVIDFTEFVKLVAKSFD